MAIASLAGSFCLMTGHQRTPYISSGISHQMPFQHRPHLLNFFPLSKPNPQLLSQPIPSWPPFCTCLYPSSCWHCSLAPNSSPESKFDKVASDVARANSVSVVSSECTTTNEFIAARKQLHGGESVIERRAHKCCWLLSGGKRCQRRCYDQLRAPSIPPTQKFTFTDECPSLTLNGTVPISELNCVTDREAVVHSCFSACLHWWENNRATAGQQVQRFDPSRDCPALVELSKSESCMIPEELLELARRDEVKGTTNGKKDV
uniref:Uncharacterized protein n=1 Tax=Globodera rostochiensis TaxID=31243 RepID=A0A914I9A6_GLORO